MVMTGHDDEKFMLLLWDLVMSNENFVIFLSERQVDNCRGDSGFEGLAEVF